jgi:hypothetical protein
MDRLSCDFRAKLDSLLARAFSAYCQGMRWQPLADVLLSHRDFERLRFLGTLGWMPLASRLALSKLRIVCNKGLIAARQGYVGESRMHYEAAKRYLDLLVDVPLVSLLGSSTYDSGVAYLDFRCGSLKESREHLDRAMDADLVLEQIGLPVMQMHRIQQGHNLVRMGLRAGDHGSAIRLAGELWAYMEHQIGELPYHHDWRPRSMVAVPRRLRRAMIQQIIGETASFIVINDASAESWGVLIEASRLCQSPEAAIFPQVQYALLAQYSRLRDDLERYLLNLEQFFCRGICHCSLLWCAVLVGLLDFCGEFGTPGSLRVRDLILCDLGKLKSLPPLFRGRLGIPLLAQVSFS